MSTVITAPSIRRLSRQLANQIAAGEVVERPASILKELLENSLDAGARQIEVDVEQGGIKRILVRDDGYGIAADELTLAVSRHATSKISTLEDLESIVSMGFRGEALASISSVSQMSIISRQADSQQAWRLLCGDPDIQSDVPEPASHPVGTSVETRDLFYNTPARKKFLRSERTEFRHIEDVIRRVALSHFHTAFVFKHNQRQIFRLPVAKDQTARQTRIARLCGKAFLQQARYLDVNRSGMQLYGWVLPPDFSRSQSDLQFFFVNGRIIRDRVVMHALRQAYGEQLHPGRHPAYVLYLNLDPTKVDVNVHPTKHEVRFHEARLVHDFLAHSLLSAFEYQPLFNTEPLSYVKQAEGNYADKSQSRIIQALPREKPLRETAANYQDKPQTADQAKINQGSLTGARQTVQPSTFFFLDMIGEYTVAQKNAGAPLLLIETQSARQYLLLEKLRSYYLNGAINQPLLFPLSLDVKAEWSDIVEDEIFTRLGFDFTLLNEDEGKGKPTLQLRKIPAVLNKQTIQQIIPLLMASIREADTEQKTLEAENVMTRLAELAINAAEPMNTEKNMIELENLLCEIEVQLGDKAENMDFVRRLDESELASLFHGNQND